MIVLNLFPTLLVSLIITSFGNEAYIYKHAIVFAEHSCLEHLKHSARERKTTIEPAFRGEFIEIFPNLIEKPDPIYPDSALEAGLEGNVVFLIFLDSEGTVRKVKLYISSGFDILDQAAYDAAWESKWTPAERRRGEFIDVITSVGYRFTLAE